MSLIKKISSLFFALFFLVAGTGFNIIRYCCSGCESQGIAYIASHSCSSLHQENLQSCCAHDVAHLNFELLADNSCETICETDNSCSITRIQTDDFPFASKLHIESLSVDDETVLFTLNFFDIRHYDDFKIKPGNSPPLFIFTSGREILTFNSVLLI